MDKIEMIAYNLDVIGAVLMLIIGLALMLQCIIKKEKVWARIFGILILALLMLLGFVLLVPSRSYSYFLGMISLIIFIVGLMELSKIIGISSIENKRKE